MNDDPLNALPHGAREAFAKTIGGNGELSERTKSLYARTWCLWVRWLAERKTRWDRAQPEDVATFLKGGAPGQGRRRQPKQTSAMKPFTKQRYWHVLNQVYRARDFNPAYELVGGRDEPTVPRGERNTELLDPGVLEQLRDPAWLRKQIPDAGANDWRPQRDRALVALVAHCGLSTGELLVLTPAHLMAGPHLRLGECAQRDLPGVEAAGQVAVDVPATRTRGKRGTVAGQTATTKLELGERTVPVPRAAVELLWEWLLRRRQLEHSEQSPLFPGARKRGGVHAALTPAMVFIIVRNCVRAALAAKGQPVKARRANSQGPAVVRNTVVQVWLAHLPREKVAQLAGLDPGSLGARSASS